MPNSKPVIHPRDFEVKLSELRSIIDKLISIHGENAELEWDPDFQYPYSYSPDPRYLVKKDDTVS